MKKLLIITFIFTLLFIVSCNLFQNTVTTSVNYRVITNKKNVKIEYLAESEDGMYLSSEYTTVNLPEGGQWMQAVTLVRSTSDTPVGAVDYFKLRVTGEGKGNIFVGFDGGFVSEYIENERSNDTGETIYDIKLNENGSIPSEILENFAKYNTTTGNTIEIEAPITLLYNGY